MIYCFAAFGIIAAFCIIFETAVVLLQKIRSRKVILPVKFVEFNDALEMAVCQHCQQCITGYKPGEREHIIWSNKQNRCCPKCGKRIRWV